MNKLTMMLAVAFAATMAMTNDALADVGPKGAVQLWAGGPYWATTNIGAEKPEDYGLYFWWGDTTGYRPSAEGAFSFHFYGDNSAIYTRDKSLSQLQSAGWVTSSGVLTPSHDAAHVKWGGDWRMPTIREFRDLAENKKCVWTWTTMNGVGGYVVRGSGNYASNSIFLPAAGWGYGTLRHFLGEKGLYWSSDMGSGNYNLSWSLWFYDTWGSRGTFNYDRYEGYPIRPVRTTSFTPSASPGSTPTLFAAISGTTVVGGGKPDLGVASVWDGWLKNGSGIVGTLQVKVGKATAAKPAKVTAAVVQRDSATTPSLTKLSFKGEMAAGATEATLKCAGQSDMSLSFGNRALAGAWNGRGIIGGRNIFASKDKEEAKSADAVLGKWLGAVNVTWNGGTASMTLAKKGKAKVAVTFADGTKAAANSQFVIGGGWCAVPVVVNKKTNLGFVVWLSQDGRTATVEGLGDDVVAGMPNPGANLMFSLGDGFGGIEGVQAALLPGSYAFGGGAKWTFHKADTVQLVYGVAVVTKDNGNPSGLKLAYKAKDGSFKGKFTVYAVQGGSLKKLTANVTGVMVGSTGYGSATIKNVGTAPVTVE